MDKINSCPNSNKCGGCKYSGLSYPEQLIKKQGHEIALLGKFGHVNNIIGADHPEHYRNKVCAAFGLDRKGHIVSGIYRSGTHEIIPSEDCLIEDSVASAIITDIRKMLPRFKLLAYNEKNGSGWLRHVLVRRSVSTQQVMVIFVAVNSIFKNQKPFLAELLKNHPEITTMILNVNDRFTPVVLGDKSKILWGPGMIEDELCGFRFKISPTTFYQVNPEQTEKLYSTAIRYAELTGKELVLDAYCGVGTIGICASPNCKQVIGVEINRDSIRAAITNAKANNIKNCYFTAGDAGKYMEQLSGDGITLDVVFMDPPRSGSDEVFLRSLVRAAPRRVVYVSCNPDTLARDLNYLTANGFQVKKIQPVDMFPYTDHVETVVLLSRI